MNFEKARFNMVEQQIRPWNVTDSRVLNVLGTVEREKFVPQAYMGLAYADADIPLGNGQFMLRPVIVARMLEALEKDRIESALLIGLGSGYLAALLAKRADWVRCREQQASFVNFAAHNLEEAGVENVIIEHAEGMMGWPERAPFDLIVLAGGVEDVPPVLFEQLAPGGQLFAFVGTSPIFKARLYSKDRDGRLTMEDVFETDVPMLEMAPAHSQFVF